jgi:hypothetical protein
MMWSFTRRARDVVDFNPKWKTRKRFEAGTKLEKEGRSVCSRTHISLGALATSEGCWLQRVSVVSTIVRTLHRNQVVSTLHGDNHNTKSGSKKSFTRARGLRAASSPFHPEQTSISSVCVQLVDQRTLLRARYLLSHCCKDVG